MYIHIYVLHAHHDNFWLFACARASKDNCWIHIVNSFWSKHKKKNILPFFHFSDLHFIQFAMILFGVKSIWTGKKGVKIQKIGLNHRSLHCLTALIHQNYDELIEWKKNGKDLLTMRFSLSFSISIVITSNKYVKKNNG